MLTLQEREHLIALGVYLDVFKFDPLLACTRCELNGSGFCLKCPACLYDEGIDEALSIIDRMLDEDDLQKETKRFRVKHWCEISEGWRHSDLMTQEFAEKVAFVWRDYCDKVEVYLDEDDNLQTLIHKAQQQPGVREYVEFMEDCSRLNAMSRVCPTCGGTGRVKGFASIGSQMAEMYSLKSGWVEGRGAAPPREGLDWLSDCFAKYYPADILIPYLSSTEEGYVRAEWLNNTYDASLDINTAEHYAEWYVLNLETDEDESKTLNLDEEANWVWLVEKIRMMRNEYRDN